MMKAMLLLLVAVVSVINAAMICVDEPSRNLTLGAREKDDKFLWSRDVVEKGSWFPWSTAETTSDFTVQRLGPGSKIIITFVQAVNLMDSTNGGYVQLVSGGINSDHVSLKFTSQNWWRGIHFHAFVYGKVISTPKN